MCVLIRSLHSLPLFNSPVQEIYSFIIFFFELGLNAFILHVLQSVHLEAFSSLR